MKLAVITILVVLASVANVEVEANQRAVDFLTLLLKAFEKKTVTYKHVEPQGRDFCSGEITEPGSYELPRPDIAADAEVPLWCDYFVMAGQNQRISFQGLQKGSQTNVTMHSSHNMGMIDMQIPKGGASVRLDIKFV